MPFLAKMLNFPLKSSVGSQLFLSVLSGALISLSGLSYFFYQALETSAKNQIQLSLSSQVENIEGKLMREHQHMLSTVAIARTFERAGIKDRKLYEQAVFDLFQQRSPLTQGFGFGYHPAGTPSKQNIYWPYFTLDIKSSEQFYTRRLQPPQDNILFVSVCELDSKCLTQDYYTLPLAARKTIWIEPYRWGSITMTSVAIPIFNDQKQLIGMTGLDINLSSLTQAANKPVSWDSGYFIILSNKGNLVAYPPNPKKAEALATYKDIPELKQVWQQVAHSPSGLISVGANYWAFQRIPENNWLMLAVVPKSVVSRPVLAIIFTGAVAAGTLMALIVFLFVRRFNSRLQPIVQGCYELAITNAQRKKPQHQLDFNKNGMDIYSQLINHQGKDELDILEQSFHQMAEQLEESFNALEKSNAELEDALTELQQTQAQVIQNEKMSSLGQLVAGVAHEINNPISFIHGNLGHIKAYTQDLLKFVHVYQQHYPHPAAEITAEAQELDVKFIEEDLPKILASMQMGTDRIRQIVLSLRNFSRMDEADLKFVDIHEGIDSTLLILQHRLKATPKRPEIEVMKDYGQIPKVECLAGQLNQVFMNLLSNAIDALEEFEPQESRPSRIWIRTEQLSDRQIAIHIKDNGTGIPKHIQNQIYNPFFTTKAVGKGTGLGLSISYKIIDSHNGRIYLNSAPDWGTEFTLELPIVHNSNPQHAKSPA